MEKGFFMKSLKLKLASIALLTFSVSSQAFAQYSDDTLNGDLDSSLDSLESPQFERPVVKQRPLSTPAAPQIYKQPTTYVQETPLTESRADQMRKNRQGLEAETETKIVEKLESSRIEDEKKRADRLFGDKFESPEEKKNSKVELYEEETPATVVIAPATLAPPTEEPLDREFVRSEIHAAVSDLNPKKPESTSYFSGTVGIGQYPDASNVRGQYALGFAFGNRFKERFLAELGFLYSNYTIERGTGIINPYTGAYYPTITEMNQYAGNAALKYQFFSGTIKPSVGALLAYTYRTFADTQYKATSETASSHAIDWGTSLGLDLELAPDYSIGADFKYMFNLSSRVDSGVQSSFSRQFQQTKPIEQFNYYVMGINMKAAF